MPWDSINQRDSCWQATTLGALHKRQTETTPVFRQKGLLAAACPGALVRGAGFWSGTYLEANRGALREWRLMNMILALFLCPATAYCIPTNKLTCSSSALIFATCHQGTPVHCLTRVASGAQACCPTGLVYLHTLKAAARGPGF